MLLYIAKYASKCEIRSKPFTNYFKDLINNNINIENETTRSVIQKALMKLTNERDYSSQEVMYFLLSLPFYSCSRPFVSLKLLEKDEYIKVKANLKTNEINQIDETNESSHELKDNYTIKNSLNEYCNRSKDCENLNMIEYFSRYVKRNNIWKLRNESKRAIVRLINKYTENENLNAKYTFLTKFPYRQKDINKYLNNEETDWIKVLKLYKTKFPNINFLELINDNILKEILINEDNQYNLNLINEPENTVNEELQYQMLSSNGPKQMPKDFPIGTRDYDTIDHIWPSTNTDNLILQKNKFKTLKENTNSNKIYTIPNVKFSQDQQHIIEFFNKQLDEIKLNKTNDKNKRVIIYGKAGCGKSLIVKYITGKLIENFKTEDNFLLMAFTGMAAININGNTIHSLLNIDTFNYNQQPLSQERKINLQSKLRNCKFIIIDEISMIGLNMLNKIDQRLKEAKSNNDWMGGMYVYLIGDFRQLPSIKDKALYTKNLDNLNQNSINGKLVYNQFNNCFILKESIRQTDKLFEKILDNLANYHLTQEDYDILCSRRKEILCETEYNSFKYAIRLFYKKQEVNDHNDGELKKVNRPICKITSKNINIPKTSLTKEYYNLEYELKICIGARVMLRTNLDTKSGLVNGALGTIKEIIYNQEEQPPLCMPAYITIDFDNELTIPIFPLKRTFYIKETICTRIQFPLLLAWALTIHKCQGMTLNKAVVDIGAQEYTIGSSYVALSRVRNLKDLILVNVYTKTRINNISKDNEMLKERQKEDEKLNKLFTQTLKKLKN